MFASYFTCMTFFLFYATIPHPRVFLKCRPTLRSRMISPLAVIGSCSRLSLALAFFGFRLSYDLTLCFETPRPPVTPSSPFPSDVPITISVCVSRVSPFILRARSYACFSSVWNPNTPCLQALKFIVGGPFVGFSAYVSALRLSQRRLCDRHLED